MSKAAQEGLSRSIGYFAARIDRINYAWFKQHGIPIGSGVTESACKRIIKQCMGGSGMKWSHQAAQHVLFLRCLLFSDGHWRTLWDHLSPPHPYLNHLLF